MDEEGGVKNEEGFTRLVTRLLLLIGSGVSRMATEVGKDERGRDGSCGVCEGGETILGVWEGVETVTAE